MKKHRLPRFSRHRFRIANVEVCWHRIDLRQNDKGFYSLAIFSSPFQPEYQAALQLDATGVKELDRWALIGKVGPVHKIEVRCEGSVCSIYEQGVQRGQLKNLGFAEGRVGLYLSGQGIAVFHDLSVEEIR